MQKLIPLAVVLGGLLACDQAPTEPTCDLTVDTLAGNAFVMAEAQPKGPNVLNPLARMKFVEEDGGVKLKYTAMSLGDIYSYDCSKVEAEGKDPELKCVEPARLQDWCEALFAQDIKCTKKKLQKLGTDASDEEIQKAIDGAKAAMKKAEEDEILPRWKAIRASLGNKLQGQVYAKVDKRCRVSVSDMYWTLRNGKKVEDTNPVGSNPFVKTDEPYMFEHCDNQAELFDSDKEGFPELPIQAPPNNEFGKPIHYYHIGKDASKAEEGCTYSIDTYAGWKPLKQGVAVPAGEEGKLEWHAEYTFEQKDLRKVQGKTVGIFHMARFKECNGKKEPIDVSCRTTVY